MQIKRNIAIVLSIVYATLTSAATCHTEFNKNDFPDCELLSPKFAVHWKIQNDEIVLGLHVDSKLGNWFGFGISENGGMRGADMVILLNSGGSWQASDRFSKGTFMPEVDATQDWKIVSTPTAKGDSVIATVSRKLKTCDDDDYEIKRGTLYPVVWAIGSSEEFGYHDSTNRGDSRINFAPSDAQTAEVTAIRNLDRSTFRNFTATMPNITIPAAETSYLCMNFELPADRKYHVVEYSPLVANKYVHHILIYQCQTQPEEPLGTLYECESMTRACATFAIHWAPGIGTVAYPPEAGFAIGDGRGVMRYAALQIHYNNPSLDAGVVDSSGMQLTYTTQLRQHDIGIFTIGTTNIEIPHGQPEVSTKPNVCISQCTKRFNQNITLLSNQFHMHYLGRGIKTQHIRGDQEIMPLGVKNYYDFNYQSPWRVDTETNILVPGDTLITTCTYDGSSRNITTTFGESSQQEMCFNFLVYYPKLPEYPEICWNEAGPSISLDYCTSWSGLFSLGNMSSPAEQELFANMTASGEIFINSTLPTFKSYEAPPCKTSSPPPAPTSAAATSTSLKLVFTVICIAVAVFAG